MSQKRLSLSFIQNILFVGIFTLVTLFSLSTAHADKHDIVSNKDSLRYYLEKNHYAIDSNAQAVILYEKGHSFLRDFVLTYKYERTIKVINPSQRVTGTLAGVVLPEVGYIHSKKIEAETYNLENGKIVKEAIKHSDILKVKVKGKNQQVKFSLPVLKKGSIIHYTFTIEYSTITSIPNWIFQHKFPTLFSEYDVVVPSFYPVTFMLHNGVRYKTVKKESDLDNLRAGTYSTDYGLGSSKFHIWVRRNVPALVDEPYQKSDAFYQETLIANVSNIGWDKINKALIDNNLTFAKAFYHDGFLKDKVNALTKGLDNDLDKAKAIYAFVRDSMVFNPMGDDVPGVQVKKAFNKRKGDLITLNILLTAMLRKAGISAYPLLLHTTSGIPLNPLFPSLGFADYYAVCAKINNKDYYLDGSGKYLPFDLLPLDCYNGYARLVDKQKGSSVNLSPNQLTDFNIVSAQVNIDSNNASQIILQCKLGEISSYEFRKSVKGDMVKAKKKVLKNFSGDLLNNPEISILNLDKPDKAVVLKIVSSKTQDRQATVEYLNAFYYKFYDKNPFKADKRTTAIDFEYLHKGEYLLRVNYPSDFKIVDAPKSGGVRLVDNGMRFNTLVQEDTTAHSFAMNASYVIGKTHFNVKQYNNIRKLFDVLLEKENQKIVLKKIN